MTDKKSFINSDILPTNLGGPEARGSLKEMGVRFLGPVEGDDLFQYVDLPDGWKKKPTFHSMWSRLVDVDGNEVANIFYKAALCDRDAFLSMA